MKRARKQARKQDRRLAVLATLILLIAIPISLIGVNTVNDIRNRASEEDVDLAFATDFTSSEVTNAYPQVPYQTKIELKGYLEPIATVSLGCNPNVCGDQCDDLQHDPPTGLSLGEDGQTIIWDNPQAQDGAKSWPITVTGIVRGVTTEGDETLESANEGVEDSLCVAQSFTLRLNESKENEPPVCMLHTIRKTDAIPAELQTPFILHGTDYDGGITEATVTISQNGTEVTTHSWEVDSVKEVFINKDDNPPLAISLDEIGEYEISAEMTDTEGLTTICKSPDTGPKLNVVIPGDNGSPEYSTDPYVHSEPSTSVLVGDSYSYTVEATDPEGDNIDYFVINNTGWLNFDLNENTDGEFKATFSGTPTTYGSYTVVIALNDGYHNHYSTQVWVINVDSPTNDTPQVSVVLPAAGTVLQQYQNTTIQWQATDRNLIVSFDVFLATDPSNESTWRPIATGIGYNYDSYVWNTGSTPPGTYYIVVRATDNQSPAGIGIGISQPFGIEVEPGAAPGEEPEEPSITESHPKITNIKPADKSRTTETKPLISADLTASDKQTIKENSIKLELDNTDITKEAEVRGEGKFEGSVLYTPDDPLSEGSHKVSVHFTDTSDQTASKTWTFTIGEEEQPTEADEDVVTILGFKIPRRIAVIIGVGLLLLLLALLIPWLFYAAWRGSRDDDWDTPVAYVPPAEPEPWGPEPGSPEPTAGKGDRPTDLFGEEPAVEEQAVAEEPAVTEEPMAAEPQPAEAAAAPVFESTAIQPASPLPEEPTETPEEPPAEEPAVIEPAETEATPVDKPPSTEELQPREEIKPEQPSPEPPPATESPPEKAPEPPEGSSVTSGTDTAKQDEKAQEAELVAALEQIREEEGPTPDISSTPGPEESAEPQLKDSDQTAAQSDTTVTEPAQDQLSPKPPLGPEYLTQNQPGTKDQNEQPPSSELIPPVAPISS